MSVSTALAAPAVSKSAGYVQVELPRTYLTELLIDLAQRLVDEPEWRAMLREIGEAANLVDQLGPESHEGIRADDESWTAAQELLDELWGKQQPCLEMAHGAALDLATRLSEAAAHGRRRA